MPPRTTKHLLDASETKDKQESDAPGRRSKPSDASETKNKQESDAPGRRSKPPDASEIKQKQESDAPGRRSTSRMHRKQRKNSYRKGVSP